MDIHAVFPCFDNDPYDENSYDFTLTDEYLKVIDFAGTKPFYRLGAHIEHWPKKYNILPPKDFHKWAVICEHVIKHYNEGWANGFRYHIEYWEIWNEPDIAADDEPDKKCWGGTKQEFFEFYDIVAKHLKKCFPDLKIGGPALCGSIDWAKDFLSQLHAPLDFFSWHCYSSEPKTIVDRTIIFRTMLNEAGLSGTESILNEWNYVKGWTGEDWIYSLKQEKSIKGAAFIAAVMCECQYQPVDLLMYYDARPCGMNGMFCTDFVCECLKGYYPFKMFHALYRLKDCVKAFSDNEKLTACAAVSNQGKPEAAVMMNYFDDVDCGEEITVELSLKNLPVDGKHMVNFYLLDQEHDMELVKTEVISGNDCMFYLRTPLFGTYFIEIKS